MSNDVPPAVDAVCKLTTHHVVCRDCPTEHLTISEQRAARYREGHERAAGHTVAVGRING